MNSYQVSIKLHKLLLLAYPGNFRREFEDEMQAVFEETAALASQQGKGALIARILREFASTPAVLFRLHFQSWKAKAQDRAAAGGLFSLQDVEWPLPPDGRDSWVQAGFEGLFFLITGLILVLITYVPGAQPASGWQRDTGMIGPVIYLLAGPGLLLGLAQGLPRWAYPLAGLAIGYLFLSALWSRLLVFFFVISLLAVCVGKVWMNALAHNNALPWQAKQMLSGLRRDGLRLSFGLYGAMPLLITIAFDNAHYNNRAPFLALSVLAMLAGAGMYIRSRKPLSQGLALLAGETLAVGMAVFGQWIFYRGSATYTISPTVGASGLVWLLELWLSASLLLILPILWYRLRSPAEQTG